MPAGRRPVFKEQGQRFKVGRHLLRLVERAGSWTATVDGLAVGDHFATQAQAWHEGVRAALALDTPTPRPPGAVDAGRPTPPVTDEDQLVTGDD